MKVSYSAPILTINGVPRMKKALSVLAALVLGICPLLFSSARAGSADIIITEDSGGTFRPLPISMDGGAPLAHFTYSADLQVYEDPTIRVERHREDAPGIPTYYYALITIKDPSQLRTASADDSFRTSAKVPANVMAKRKNAVIAINGDYCAAFAGNKANSFVLRQGTVYRDTVEPGLDLLLIDETGEFTVITADQDLAAADKTQVNGKKVINAFQFGPALVIDGRKVDDALLVDKSHSPAYAEPGEKAQRMCIAQIDTLHYMVLCCRWGMTLPSLRDLAMSIADCKVVYTLDGGLSSQMIFMNRKINNISAEHADNPRPITDIIYFASAWYQ